MTTKKKWKRKTQKEAGSWAAHQSRSAAEAPSWSSQHLLLPRSQGKHIILTDAQLNGFCGETFTVSVTVSADSPKLQPTQQNTHTHTKKKPSHNPVHCSRRVTHSGRDRTQPQFSNVWSIWSLYHTSRLNHGWTQAPVRVINSPTSENMLSVGPTFTVKHYRLVFCTVTPSVPSNASALLNRTAWAQGQCRGGEKNTAHKNSKHLFCDLATTRW